ncbi:hypothetical protein PHYPSEUDO_011047, partial [Phytophthora pseudosyringae]
MRINVGANKKLIGSDCFRLLSLVPEVQNDVEVLKPVLDELEVMRLSCSLGMLSSVNPKDFEMEMLEAQEFDDDLALFLRKEVFGTDEKREADGVKVISLFGKQHAVKYGLEGGGWWSDEMESNLKAEDQGIYCVLEKDDDDDNDDSSDDDSGGVAVVLFGWLQDDLFRKSRLRETATYVLRFLTCLSANMVCCLSPEDVELLERTVASMNSSNLDAWKSFSVAFHVERQEEQKDAVACEKLADVPLPRSSSAQNLELLKGSYPAFSVVEPAPATKWTESSSQRFDSVKEFSSWLINESKQRNLGLELDRADPTRLRTELLKATDRWPETELKEIEDVLGRSLQSAVEQSKDRVQAQIEEHRATLLRHISDLFNLDVLHKAAKTEPAFVMLHAYVQEVQSDRGIWSQVDPVTKVVLTLPLRLKKHVKALAITFREHLAEDPDATEAGPALAKFLREITVSEKKVTTSNEGLFGRLWKAVTSQESELLSDEFRQCMAEPLSEAQQIWFDAVDNVLDTAEKVLLAKASEETERSLRQSCQADERKVISEACNKLLFTWRGQHEGGLMTTIRPRVRNPTAIYVYCDVRKEHWKPATDRIKVFKLTQNDNGTFSTVELGCHRLEPGAKLLKAFSIKTHSVVLVTTSSKGTLVERVNFPLQKPFWGETLGSVDFTRSFGRSASLCDFDVQERVVAFVEEGGRVVLYRFNETFSSLEIYKRVELSLRTSLTLPVVDVLLVDGSLYATDTNGSIQSVDLKNQQTSRAVQIMPSGPCTPSSSLFAMADNLVLGFLGKAGSEDSTADSQDTELFAVASEDFRKIPVNCVGNSLLRSKGLSVQCFDDLLFAVNVKRKKICVVRLSVTVRSESFRIQHSKEHSVNGSKADSDGSDADAVDHWLRAFYHTYEKFPVRGLIRGVDDTRATLKLYLTCTVAMSKSTEESCRYFFQVMMRDLRKLNKPLGGMDLARDLTFLTESNAEIYDVAPQPVRAFLQQLITFVPIQICRAEANSLTVMTNGKAQPMNGSQSQDVQAVDIARSIRFGLLSPLLESWQGRCVVVTSMGKQSTGKSYLLNHLTGSSFAIAGARCTDGAWMSIRILPKNVLLVVLDFEGLGSFERTEQEDVFLSVLNASISMFTIFRMEMRYDKEVDDLFSRFQKGVALIKGDP